MSLLVLHEEQTFSACPVLFFCDEIYHDELHDGSIEAF